MTFQEIINRHPHPSDLDRDLLLRCIDECLDCGGSCAACALTTRPWRLAPARRSDPPHGLHHKTT